MITMTMKLSQKRCFPLFAQEVSSVLQSIATSRTTRSEMIEPLKYYNAHLNQRL